MLVIAALVVGIPLWSLTLPDSHNLEQRVGAAVIGLKKWRFPLKHSSLPSLSFLS
jgi:hypothetical protein